MIKQFPGRGHIVPISLVLIGAAVLKAQLPPDASQTSANSVKVVNAFGQNWGFPGPLLEVSPGTFSGLTVGATGTYNARAFLLTSQGALTTTYVFSTNSAVPGPFEVQAVNGRLYSGQGAPSEYFSLDLRGNIQFYPPVLPSPITFSVPTADGKLYGTESTYIGDNAFGMVTLDGAVTVLHNFSAQEGIPYGLPILASDGNFYGISGLGGANVSSSAMVYRMTPAGSLTILATYSDGRPNFGPGNSENLLQASNGKLYGTAAFGGKSHAGAIFEMSLNGAYKTLYEFTHWPNGMPATLIEASDGNLYGVAQSWVQIGGAPFLFRITLAGQFETLARPIGTCPCPILQGSDGKIYGTSLNGGPDGIGAAWVWDLGLPKPLPKIKGLLPSSGAVGTSVTISGAHLLGATAVGFNGTPATLFSSVSNNFVTATVPPGAATGPVTATTPNGSVTSSALFTVQ